MSEITRDKLNRGTKLTVDHVFDPLNDIANNLNNGTINQENIEADMSSFRININVPVIDTEIVNHYGLNPDDGFPRGGYCVPFMVPPLQEFYEPQFDTVSYNYNTPDLVLDEFSFSFDQRSEPSIITSRFWDHFTAGTNVGENSGMLSYEPDQTGKLELKFVIYEKTPTIFKNADLANFAGGNQVSAAADVRNMYTENIVFEARVEMLNLIDKTYRLNPFIRTEINKILDPYKSYMIGVYADGLYDFTTNGDLNFALVNCQIGLRFKTQLVETYRSNNNIATPQNSPIESSKTGHSIVLSTPNSGNVIQADAPNGLQTNMTTIDAALEGKLKGGLSKWANAPGIEAIESDGAYDVIYIPMFSNPFNNVIKNSATPSSVATGLTHGTINQLPYIDLGNLISADDNICDRRVITIPYPYEIHHAYACVNYLATTDYAQDAFPSIHHNIGIGIGTGLRSDEYTYEQVSHMEWDQKWEDDPAAPVPWTIPANLIDRWLVPFREPTTLPKGQSYDGSGPGLIAWEVYSLPMMTGVVNGKGYVTQGDPYFVGKGTGASTNNYSYLGTPARTNVGNGGGATITPKTKGAEQFIECRWKISTPDTYNQAPGSGFSNLLADQTIIGYQGNYIVLICKKYLTKGE